MVIADSLQRLLPLERYLAVLAGAAVVLPLCFMDQQHLAFSSTLSIAANLYVCCVLVAAFSLGWRGDPKLEDVEDCCLLGFGRGDLAMVSVLMQAAVVQMCILPMYEQMDHRSPRRFAACLGISFGFVALLFIGFSGIAYIAIGPKVSSNVLLDLPHGPFGSFARVVMAFAVIGVYPILTSSMVAPIRHQESGPWQPRPQIRPNESRKFLTLLQRAVLGGFAVQVRHSGHRGLQRCPGPGATQAL